MKSPSKQISTVIKDIYSLLESGKKVSEESIERLGKSIALSVKKQLTKREESKSPSLFRMSTLGRGDRFLHYSYRDRGRDEVTGSDKIRFIYGDIIEEILLFLIREAGHSVIGEQDMLTINGIRGIRDLKLDGINTEVKSASPYAFTKIFTGSLMEEGNDPFGYVYQVSGYTQADQNKPYQDCDEPAAILAANKVDGRLALLMIEDFQQPDISARIDHLRKTVTAEEQPERCYSEVDDGKSGNKKLGSNCGWCKYKVDCWKDSNNGNGLRVFRYSNGIRFLTHVEKEPKVEEIDV